MRIYEFAKEHNLTSKEIITFLEAQGFDCKSHMMVIDDQMLKAIKKQFLKKIVAPAESKINSSKKNKSAEKIVIKKDSKQKKESLKPVELQVDQIVEKSIEEPLLVVKNIVKEKELMPVLEKQSLVQKQKEQKNSKLSNHVGGSSVNNHHRGKQVAAPAQAVVLKKQNFSKAPSEKLVIEEISLLETPLVIRPLTVVDFSVKTGKPVSEVIITLLRSGAACNKNYLLSEEKVLELTRAYGLETMKASAALKPSTGVAESGLRLIKTGKERLPIVVVMGHVDHGKTTLLDYIRKTRVVAREKGGITQHIGAYEAHTPQGNIVFLDTPGHEAFSKVRHRGAYVADLGILVVAADDGVMPQTVECIKALKTLEIPIVVAINKIDKVDKIKLEVVKRQLSQYDLLPEEWGGTVVCLPISAKEGTGIDSLLEMIILQSQMMDLQGALDQPGEGYILESKIEKGRGSVATVIFRHGVAAVGSFFIAGDTVGKIVSLRNSSGALCQSVGPSTPIIITGFDKLPSIGSLFRIVDEKEYKAKSTHSDSASSTVRKSTLSVAASTPGVLNLIVKAEGNASLEAVLDGIDKISKQTKQPFFMVHSGVGSITENDVMLAETSSSHIIGFGVKADHNALLYGKKVKIDINLFDIIYRVFEDIEKYIKKHEEVKKIIVKIGEAAVLKVFDVKKFGIVAGSYIRDGRFSEKGSVKIWRGKKMVGEGKIKSLQRDKKSVKEVHSGFECAFLVDGFEDWQVDDRVECFLEVTQ